MSNPKMYKATGRFDVEITPQKDDVAAGRMVIEKHYEGEIQGVGRGQMLSKQVENGVSVYCAIEEFQGEIDGKKGGFTLLHNGQMQQGSSQLDITVIAGSGTDELNSIAGKLHIKQVDGEHTYIFDYSL
ncbi:DUF3224 domain-containing protein [Salinimonas chungwhensis]|uniref:DUF3224 domain-containing protein n=1 Tax=Salinimonas chungwhensis TaxID=265425 RepID=UPI0003662E4C|nr:DUF3224 domain-containing protein [Salinimonas chungwhensis]